MATKKKKKKNDKQVVIITGASSGIGKATALLFAENGYHVYGVARKDFSLPNVTTVLGDVSSQEDMKNVVDFVLKQEGKIDILINNAGFGISGASEFSKVDDIRKIFDVNFIGAVTLTQLVLPHMRRRKQGRIINTSSVASFIPIPFQAFYSATKSALDTWAKALRIEVAPFNIKVTNVLPGDIKTEFTSRRQKSAGDTDGIYAEQETRSIAKMEKDEQNGMSPLCVAKVMLKIANKKKPPATKTVGFGYKAISFLVKIVPQQFMLWIVKLLYGW